MGPLAMKAVDLPGGCHFRFVLMLNVFVFLCNASIDTENLTCDVRRLVGTKKGDG